MKLLKLMSLCLLVIFVSSCSSDDDSGNNAEASLVGTWIANTVNYEGTTETEIQGQAIVAQFTGEGYNIDFSLTFTENPNNLTSEGSYDIELTTTVLGQTTTENVEDITWDVVGEWQRSGSTITVTLPDGESADATIVEITETTLTLSFTDVRTENNAGIVVTTNTQGTATFTKM